MWGKDFTTTSCEGDFVVFPINTLPGTTQANIIAFHHLYTNCLVSAPKTLWAYRIGDGPVGTSPVLSLDGSEVAFVENSSRGATFHVLKWSAGEGSGPFDPAQPCKSCLRSVTYAPTQPSTRSSPFVDYWLNTAFVGADDGYLYAIGPVFGRQDSLTVIARSRKLQGTKLTSPVVAITGLGKRFVFVSDGSRLYAFTYGCSLGQCGFDFVGSYTVSEADAEAIQDSALADVDRGRVFWFSRRDATGQSALLIETDYELRNVVTATLGPASAIPVRSGAFDDAHLSSGGQKGNLYACGKTGNGKPVLYRFRFDNGDWTRTAPVTNENVSSHPADCSPLTTFSVGGTDRLFLGVAGQNENQSEVQMWVLPVGPTTSDWPDQSVNGYGGGSSGIIVDNRSDSPERNNIYFLTPAPTKACKGQVCAVKLTQSALR